MGLKKNHNYVYRICKLLISILDQAALTIFACPPEALTESQENNQVWPMDFML